MSNPWKSEEIKDAGSKKPESVALVRRSAGGALQMTRVSQKTATSMAVDSYNPNLSRINAYFEAVFNKKSKDTFTQEEKEKRFISVLDKTHCLNCEDKGYYLIEMEAPNGKNYQFAYSCVCNSGISGTGSIIDLVNAGIYQFSCHMGGKTGEYCPLKAKAEKCSGFVCPKFDKGAVR